MIKMEKSTLPRRQFLTSVSFGLAATGLSELPFFQQKVQETLESQLPQELSLEEWEWVKKSKLARIFPHYFNRGSSCSVSLFSASLKYMTKPEELAWIACGFGGGMFHKDVCGLMTAGIMSLGLWAGDLKVDEKDAETACKSTVKEFWQWWHTQAPLHCREIRPAGDSGKKVCVRLGQLAAAKIEMIMNEYSPSQEEEPEKS